MNISGWWQHFKIMEDIRVFHVDLTPDLEREAHALAWLDEEEHARWERSQSLSARRRFALCRAALRALLCLELACENKSLAFVPARHDKPSAVVGGLPASVSFNVSHSGNHGLIAMAPRGRLGVDVEERVPRRNLENLIERVLTPGEQVEMEGLDGREQLHTFLRFWTIKEAFAKAHGQGLSMRFAELEIPDEMRSGAVRSSCRFLHVSEALWCLEDLGTKDFAAAIVHDLGPPGSVAPFDEVP